MEVEADRHCTRECTLCGKRKPLEGFRLLAKRSVAVCPTCQPAMEPYIGPLDDFADKQNEAAARFVISLIRISSDTGKPLPSPQLVAEQIDRLSPVIGAIAN